MVRCGEEGCGVDGRRERDGRRAEVRKSAGGIKGSRRDELSMIRPRLDCKESSK